MATGKYDPLDKSNTGNNTNLFQLGTGSTDFLAGFMYDIRLHDAGINVNANYKINTANKWKYHYGNKASLTTQAYYKWKNLNNKWSIAPNIGLQYEKADTEQPGWGKYIGGNVLIGSTGFEMVN